MKIFDIFNEIITEDFKNKKILNALIGSWYGEDATEEQRATADDYATKFWSIKDRISEKNPRGRTFLNRFQNFSPEKLNDILSYSLEQMEFILDEFELIDKNDPASEESEFPLIFKTQRQDRDHQEESKKLWYSKNRFLVVDEGDFRVYKMDKKETSRNFGYYDRYLVDGPFKSHRTNTWCIGRTDADYNAWSSYRSKRTFYFCIDETRDPAIEKDWKKSQYYISVLQATTDSATGFRLTPIVNDGSDPVVTDADIYRIYPKMQGHLEKIVKVPYDEKYELGEITDTLDLVDENPTNRYEFAKVNYKLRKRYIERFGILTTQRSWDVLDDVLKKLYIDSTTVNNMFERFRTKEILMAIKAINKDYKTLDSRLKYLQVKAGFGELMAKFMASGFITDMRKNLDGGNISLYQNRVSKKYGLFSKGIGSWFEKDGIVYDDEFELSDDTEVFDDDEGNFYDVSFYIKKDGETTFVFMTPIDGDGFNGYILTKKKWEELNDLAQRRDSGEDDVEVNFDTEKDSDINEIN